MHCTDEHCLTCSDALLSVRVLALCEESGLALVEVKGQQEEVDVSLVEQVAPGDLLLVHGGVALARQIADERGEA
ncbi:MAG TPA: HypC/HybG/HupF family hydrogenase formation chaperone [Ktedonobacteraceae bacterium]